MDVKQLPLKLPLRMLKNLLMLCFLGMSLTTLAAENKKTVAPVLKVENFTKLSSSRQVKISPDGKHLSIVLKNGKEDILAILDINTLKPVGLFKVNGARRNVSRVYWVNNKRVVYTIATNSVWNKQRGENGELYGVNIDGKKHKRIFGYRSGEESTGTKIQKKKANNGSHQIIDFLKGDDKHILIAFYPWRLDNNYWRINRDIDPVIQRLNVYNGKTKKVDHLFAPLANGIADSKGNVRFSISIDDDNEQVIAYKAKVSDPWQEWSLKDFEGTDLIPFSFTADDQQLYFSANVNGGTRALYLLTFKDQSIKKVFHNEKVDVNRAIRGFSNRQIIAASTELGLPAYHYLDLKDPKTQLHRSLRATFEGSDISITSATEDTNKVIVRVYSDREPSAYYLYDRKKNALRFLVSSKDWIDPEQMASIETMTIKTRDDADIYAYLTKPKGLDKNLPMVVLPHGGPHGVRDWWGFDWEVQLLANRGYAVLQVNYRGSGGFGDDYESIGHGKWGTLMQDDITDATKALIDSGVADAKRICIYGGSYGAYAAMMGAVKEPELYQCAIGSAGVYDLPLMFKEGDIPEQKSGLAYLKKVLGEDVEDQKRRSPAYNAEKIKAPVLLIHGGQDKRAPMEQADSLRAAFDKIDKDYQWLEIGDEAHGYYDEANRLVVYNKILAFLEQHIGAK